MSGISDAEHKTAMLCIIVFPLDLLHQSKRDVGMTCEIQTRSFICHLTRRRVRVWHSALGLWYVDASWQQAPLYLTLCSRLKFNHSFCQRLSRSTPSLEELVTIFPNLYLGLDNFPTAIKGVIVRALSVCLLLSALIDCVPAMGKKKTYTCRIHVFYLWWQNKVVAYHVIFYRFWAYRIAFVIDANALVILLCHLLYFNHSWEPQYTAYYLLIFCVSHSSVVAVNIFHISLWTGS